MQKMFYLRRPALLFLYLVCFLWSGCDSLFSCNNRGDRPEPAKVARGGDPIAGLSAQTSSSTEKVNIRGVVKNAVAITAGAPIIVSLDDAAQGVRFAAGVVPDTASGPVKFAVSARGATLAEFEVDPASTDGWREFKVRVEGEGARQVSITCEFSGAGAYIGHPRPWSKNQDPPWVVFILIDALRADSLGIYGERMGRSPELDALGREGVVFDRAYTSSPFTLTSVASIFTGLHPWQHKVLFSAEGGLVLSESVPSLVERFQQAGFHTAAFSGTYFFFSRNGFARGFDTMDETCWQSFFRESADCLNQRLLPWLTEHADEPVFLYIHYVDPHAPYFAPEPYHYRYTAGLSRPQDQDTAQGEIEQFSKSQGERSMLRKPSSEDIKYLRGLYRGEVEYVDSQVGELTRKIREALLPGAPAPVIVITADHGEAFYEHEVMDHVADLHDPVMRVPLIFNAPGRIPEGLRLKDQARTIDLLPTLLDLVGIQVPAGLPGRSLAPLWKGDKLKPEPAAAIHYVDLEPEYALLTWPWKILYRPKADAIVLYRLDEDPKELTDLSSSMPAKARELKALLEKLLALPSPQTSRAAIEQDPETIKKLRDIGYTND